MLRLLRISKPLRECHEYMYMCVHACVCVDIYMYVHLCMYMYIYIADVAAFKNFKASA